METIKVNMTPCEDIKTIHASQNDNEAREWGFELHNNGEKIDSSSISDQMVFKAYKGGTEEILPTNGSTPTTSPFKGDIKYPQGLLTDQEFTYRQSPTESDGLAWIKSIKGNTLVWKQSVQNGNFADTSGTGFGVVQGTVSYANNTATVSPNVSTDRPVFRVNQTISVANHRMLLMVETSEPIITFVAYTSGWTEIIATNEILRVGNRNFIFFTPSSATSIHYLRFNSGLTSIAIKNVMCFDLTQMGLDISNPSDFTSLFPLPYYAYNQGTLLSFMGNGIKTVGKNQLPKLVAGTYSLNGITANVDNDGYIYVSGNAYTSSTTIVIPLEQSFKLKKGMYCHAFNNRAEGSITPTFGSWYFSLTPINRIAQCPDTYDGTEITNIRLYISANTNPNITLRPMLAFTNEVTPYEPYTSSTLSLPISTYFSNGMKSAGSVYDELTETKAITRIGEIDFGSLTWNYNADYQVWVSTSGIANSDQGCLLNANIPYQVISLADAPKLGSKINNTYNIWVRNGSNTIQPSGIAYYILAAPTETSFTTASLVTENAKIPLSNEDGVLIGKCTEQLSSESGFFDAKIKLADEDGECYSNKIQLHIERSPQ